MSKSIASETRQKLDLNQQCLDAVNAPIDAVIVEVDRMEAAGELSAPSKRLAAASAPLPRGRSVLF